MRCLRSPKKLTLATSGVVSSSARIISACFFSAKLSNPSPVNAYILPKTSLNSSLKVRLSRLLGKVCLISPIFLRTWYQICGISLEKVLSFMMINIIDSLGREKLLVWSKCGTSCSFFSSLSVTCCSTSCALAPGKVARTSITLNVNGGSSDWPSLV